jgi:hypothetical protein
MIKKWSLVVFLNVDSLKIRIVKIRQKKRLSKMSNTKMFISSTKIE